MLANSPVRAEETKPEEYKTYTIKRGTKYSYDKAGLFEYDAVNYPDKDDYSTYTYLIDIDGKTYESYCCRPSMIGPHNKPGNTGKIVEGKDDITTRILYYGASIKGDGESPAGSAGYFKNIEKKYTGAQQLIITHIALGKADEDPEWYMCTSKEAQDQAEALIEYAKNKPTVIPEGKVTFGKKELTTKIEGDTQTTEEVEVKGSPEQSAEFTLPEGVGILSDTVKEGKDGKVKVNGKDKFRFRFAKDFILQHPDGYTFDIEVTENYKEYFSRKFLTKNSDSYQNLGILNVTPNTIKTTENLKVKLSSYNKLELSTKDMPENSSLILEDKDGKQFKGRSADGKLIFEQLAKGEYKVVFINTITNEVIKTEERTITVDNETGYFEQEVVFKEEENKPTNTDPKDPSNTGGEEDKKDPSNEGNGTTGGNEEDKKPSDENKKDPTEEDNKTDQKDPSNEGNGTTGGNEEDNTPSDKNDIKTETEDTTKKEPVKENKNKAESKKSVKPVKPFKEDKPKHKNKVVKQTKQPKGKATTGYSTGAEVNLWIPVVMSFAGSSGLIIVNKKDKRRRK